VRAEAVLNVSLLAKYGSCEAAATTDEHSIREMSGAKGRPRASAWLWAMRIKSHALVRANVVVFAGAGAVMGLRTKSWEAWIRKIASRL